MIGSIVLLILVAMAPVAVLVAAAGLYRRVIGQRNVRRAARRPATRAPRPIEQVAADLRRLHRQLQLVPTAAPQTRGRALVVAYDRVLAEAAALLDVPEALRSTPEGWDRDGERLQVEVRLARAGLRVDD